MSLGDAAPWMYLKHTPHKYFSLAKYQALIFVNLIVTVPDIRYFTSGTPSILSGSKNALSFIILKRQF